MQWPFSWPFLGSASESVAVAIGTEPNTGSRGA